MRRHPRGDERGQALVEFALVCPVVLISLLFMLMGLFYVLEVTSVVGAAQTGSRVAAAAAAGQSDQATLGAVATRLPGLLEPGLPGTRLEYDVDGSIDRPCPVPGTVTEPGRIVVCTGYEPGADPAAFVRVRIYGHLPALFPGFPAFPVDEQSVVHTLTFQR